VKTLTFSRRQLLQAAAGVSLLATKTPEEILPGLSIFPSSVNTARVERNGKKLLIDSGDLTSAPGGGVAEWALYTHHHRDQASGAPHLAAAGTRILVPLKEKRLFEDARTFWDAADNILDHRYNFRPHLFTIRESVPVARALQGGEVHQWEGLTFEVIDTPGHTDGSVTYLLDINAKRVAFTGDLISGPGQIWEIYSLQKRFVPQMRYDYHGFAGAVNDVKASLDRVLEAKPDILVPSHGVIINDPVSAVAKLKENLDAAMDNFLTTATWRISPNHIGEFPRDKPPQMFPPLPDVSYPKWIRDIGSTTKAIMADDRSVFLSDCGHPKAIEELARLQAAGEISSVDGLWITHYHDDHTEFVNAAKRQFGAEVYVQKEIADIIENPTAYQMPCLFPESIRVDRVLEDGETFHWKGFQLTAYHFPGQTLYHDGLLVERDGTKVFFTGDSFSNWGIDDYCSQNRCFLGPNVGYQKCFQILLDTKPDVLVAAHWGPEPISAEYLRRTVTLFKDREKLYAKLFPHDDVNFGTDPCWIRAYPYRQNVMPGVPVVIEARVMNHSSKRKHVRAELKLPHDWNSGPCVGTQEIPAQAEGRIRLEAVTPSAPNRRRYVIGLAVTIDGQPLGEFAEAIVNFLSS
jgi:glyoxylase-like metal-dependent hydrolase (beta-lactamase superfamily II)